MIHVHEKFDEVNVRLGVVVFKILKLTYFHSEANIKSSRQVDYLCCVSESIVSGNWYEVEDVSQEYRWESRKDELEPPIVRACWRA